MEEFETDDVNCN